MRLREVFFDTAKHFLVYGVGMMASRLATLILIPLYTHSFGVAHYGVFAMLTITLGVVSTVSQLGVNAAFLRSYFDYDNDKDRARLMGTAFIMVTASSLVFLLGMGLLSVPLARMITGSEEFAICLWLLGATLLADNLFGLYCSLLRAEKRSIAFTVANTGKLIATCVFAVILVAVLKRGVIGAVTANCLSTALVCLVILPQLIKRCDFSFHKEEAAKLMAFGLPLAPMNISSSILASADRYFLLHMTGTLAAGATVVGVYSLLCTYASVFRIGVIEPLFMIWLPQMLAMRDKDNANEFYSRAFSFYVLFSGFLALCLTVAYTHIIRLVSGPAFLGPPVVVWLVLVSLVFVGSTRLLGVGMTFARKTTYSALFYTMAGIINTVLNYLLIPKMGMLGAGIATLAGSAILPACYHWAGQKYHRVDYEWMLVSRVAGLFLFLSGAYFALPRLGITGSYGTMADVMLALLYFPLAVLMGALNLKEVRSMMDRVRNGSAVAKTTIDEGGDMPC